MDTIEMSVNATRKISREFIRGKAHVSHTSGSNISLVTANVPVEIKHEHIARSDIELGVILHIEDELCQCH